MGIIPIILKNKNICFLYLNYLITLKKYKYIYTNNIQKENCFKNYKLITFFKKSNVFFKTSITSNKVLKKKPLKVTPRRLRIRGKKKFNIYNISLQKKDKKKAFTNKLK